MRTASITVALAATLVLALAASAVASGAAPAARSGQQAFEFKVTIRNLGRADLTPPVYAVHNRSFRLWRLGKKASPGIANLAEDGATALALAEARAKRGLGRANVGPRIAPGRSASFRVRTTNKHLRLSWASMQVCTNDTFAGQTNARLPAARVGARKVVRLRAMDAGSERNTEDRAHVPCLGAHNVGPNERGVIKRSQGIKGTGDVDNRTQGWGRFLARVTIKRVG